LLEAWQAKWEELHQGHERNARKAAKCDKTITKINQRFDKEWKNIMILQSLVSQIPQVTQEIENALKILGEMESVFSDVEISLLALEDTIDARELQENQLEYRYQLAMHQEKSKVKFNELSNQLQAQYQLRKQEVEKKKKRDNQERQKHYQEKFERDMSAYRVSGSTNRLAPPKSFDPDASLETVDLNEDESGLEKFLSEDLLYDVSPLPKDDDDNLSPLNILTKQGSRETLHNEIQTLEESALHETSSNPIIRTTDQSSDDEYIDDHKEQHANAVLSTLEKSQPQIENNAVSVSESLYYTPDDTLEELSDLSIR